MSLASQAAALRAQGAGMRRSIFGVTATGEPQLFVYAGRHRFGGYFSSLALDYEREELNARETVNCVVRALKSEIPVTPMIGESIRVIGAKPDGTDLIVKFDQFLKDHPTNPEWVLGCNQP